MDTTVEKEKRTSKKNVDGRSTSSHDNRNLEPDQWRNREEWLLVSGRRRQLLKNRIGRLSKIILKRIVLCYMVSLDMVDRLKYLGLLK